MSSFLVEDWMSGNGLKLSGNELILYALIFSYSRKGKTMFESEDNLAKKYNLSRKQVSTILKKLRAEGLITRSESKHPGLQSYDYTANLDKVLPFYTPSCEEITHLKGLVSNKVTPRCEEITQQDENLIHIEMGRKVTPRCEEITHNNIVYNTKDNTIDNVVFSPSFEQIKNLILPILFFKNNCSPLSEARKFYDHYKGRGWKLGGGEILNNDERIRRAAKSWKIKDVTATPFPQQFIRAWEEIYPKAPPELQDDMIRISAPVKTSDSITIYCSQALAKWISTPDTSEMIRLIMRIHCGEKYRFQFKTKDEKRV